MVRRPSRQPAMQIRIATASAAAESAHHRPNRTPPSPISTASEAHRSDEKCSASASSAWLCVCLAVRDSARERKKSTAIDTAITPKAQAFAITACSSCSVRRLTASQITTPESRNSSAVSASAETLSTLPWP